MAPFYQRPENALKRAEELVAVGQDSAALQLLHEVLLSKRSRGVAPNVLENIMLRFVELSVDQRKTKVAKDGLIQYRNSMQNTNIVTIETAVRRLVELAESKVTQAQAKAEKVNLDAIEDLEATETPESILMSMVSGDQSKDRTDRSLVTPWLRFLWETYRNILDVLRNNARLELVYHSVAHQAIQFCLKFSRKTEFRRLCDLLRNHLASSTKHTQQTYSINIKDPDTLQRHLEVRFQQLNASTDLELWQEAFRTVEDIHNLLVISKRTPKPYMLASYFGKMTAILNVSGNHLFHAAAWLKYYSVMKTQPKLGASDLQRYATNVLLAVLAVPVIDSSTKFSTIDVDDSRSKSARLSLLLALPQIPTRSSLLADMLSEGILDLVRPELRDLYEALEVRFHPLSICKRVSPILAGIAEDPQERKYVEPLHAVILIRLIEQLSQVYSTVKLDFVAKLASFPDPFDYDELRIERFIMQGCKRGDLSILIDHRTNSLVFDNNLFDESAASSGASLQPVPAELIRTQLSRLSVDLSRIMDSIAPERVAERMARKTQALAAATDKMEEEHERVLARKAVIERKKELIETLMVRKEKEEARQQALVLQETQEAERKRLEEDQRRREQERRQREIEAIQREEARKLADQLKDRVGLEVDINELKDMDAQKLLDLQVTQLEKEKQEKQEILRSVGRFIDHLERACRKEEAPLLKLDYKEQIKRDRIAHESFQKQRVETARTQHQYELSVKKRMTRMIDDYTVFKERVLEQGRAELVRLRKEAQANVEAEKARRIEQYRQLKKEQTEKREREEKERAQQEAEEAARKEEQVRQETERKAKLEKEKEEVAEQQKKLDDMGRKQREREAEVEAKQQARLREMDKKKPAAAPFAPTKYVPPALRRAAASSSPSTQPASGGPPGEAATWRRAEAPRPPPPPTEASVERKPDAWRPQRLMRRDEQEEQPAKKNGMDDSFARADGNPGGDN